MGTKEKGITLISLAVTVVLMSILAGIMITSNSTNQEAIDLASEKKTEAEILSVKEQIKTELTENPPSSYEILISRLKKYGTIQNETDYNNAKLVTKKGNYTINVRDIWNINPNNIVQ